MNTKISGYEIVEQIAQGGMGAVYKAYRIKDSRLVAFKVIRSDEELNEVSEVLQQRFLRELHISKSLAHPYVVKIIDGGSMKDGSGGFIVMEYVDGLSLQNMIGSGCDEQMVRNVMCQMAEAFSYIHSRNLVHRDVKPANIVIDNDGRTVLVDFGLAFSQDLTRLSATSERVGTMLTMAPEQLIGETIDGRADIYALGVTIYWLLAGEAPYSSEQVFQIAVGMPTKPPLSLIEIGVNISKDLNNIIMRSFALDKDLRFQSANELLLVLEGKSIERKLPKTLPAKVPTDNKKGHHRILIYFAFVLLFIVTFGTIHWQRISREKNNTEQHKELKQDLVLLRTELLESNKIPDNEACEVLGCLVERSGVGKRLLGSKNLSRKLKGLYYYARLCREKKRFELFRAAYEQLLSSKELIDSDSFLHRVRNEQEEFLVSYADALVNKCDSLRRESERKIAGQKIVKTLAALLRRKPQIRRWREACSCYVKGLRLIASDESREMGIQFVRFCQNANLPRTHINDALIEVGSLLTAYRGIGVYDIEKDWRLAKEFTLDALDHIDEIDKLEHWILFRRAIHIDLKLGNFPEAKERLEKVLANKKIVIPPVPLLVLNADINAYQGDYNKAIEMLKKGLKLKLTPKERASFESTIKQWRGYAVFRHK